MYHLIYKIKTMKFTKIKVNPQIFQPNKKSIKIFVILIFSIVYLKQ